MRTVRATTTAALLLGLLCAPLAHGCGGGSPRLDFGSDPGVPVITYMSYKAIAPVYNPGVPVAVIYPGAAIRKDGPYDLKSAPLTRKRVSEILERLDDLGFFTLKKEYSHAEPLAGGTTEKLTVNLASGTYVVSVEGGAGPPDWDDIVATVIKAQASDFVEYVPLSLILHAGEADRMEAGAEARPWPGDPQDLARAAAGPPGASAGVELEGDRAAEAWKAISACFSEDGEGEETYWSAGGRLYRYVYAEPALPGVDPGT